MNNRAWDFDEARDACRLASKAQQAAEEELRNACRQFALAEERYRVALAKRIVELQAGGVAWTACADIARGAGQVAELRRDRDIKRGVYEAMEHAAWRHNADRKDAQRFADWSMRRELAEAVEQPQWTREAA